MPEIIGSTIGTGVTVTLPAGIEEGDLILIARAVVSSGATASGYSATSAAWCLYRIAAGNETNATINGSVNTRWVAAVVRGVDTNPANWHQATSGFSLDAPSIAQDGELLICMGVAEGFFGTLGPLNVPSGMTLIGRTPAAGVAAAMAALPDPPNPTGTRTFTGEGDDFPGLDALTLLLTAAEGGGGPEGNTTGAFFAFLQ